MVGHARVAHSLRLLLLVVVAAIASGCAYKNDPTSRYEPLLYEVTGDDVPGRVWLFGGIHTGKSRFYPLPDAIERALQGSDRLAVELDAGERHNSLRAAFLKTSRMPAGTTMESVVDGKLLRDIRNHYGYGRLEWDNHLKLQPWALSLLLQGADDSRMRTEAAHSVDSYVMRRARDARMQIVELERPEEQVGAFTGGTMQEQAQQLAERFGRVKRFEGSLQELVDAWSTGDERKLSMIKDRNFGTGERLAGLRQRMFVERDRRMASRLAEMMREGGSIFACVGALHLVGEDGLPKALASLGLKVRRIGHDGNVRPIEAPAAAPLLTAQAEF